MDSSIVGLGATSVEHGAPSVEHGATSVEHGTSSIEHGASRDSVAANLLRWSAPTVYTVVRALVRERGMSAERATQAMEETNAILSDVTDVSGITPAILDRLATALARYRDP